MIRLLVACPTCKRQFDATGSDPGDRFHCLCGSPITVPRPKPHDAAVVRCSSCGANREDDATACAHCGSDFTVHERDLHTICPQCAARVSDRASYCHHCATRLDPQGRPGEPTSTTCPACGDGHHVTSRDFGVAGLSILECPSCAGLWLGHDAFRHLVDRAAAAPTTSKIHAMASTNDRATPTVNRIPLEARTFYRPCLECGRLMQRRNYDDRSGVIVDVCGAHGVWFDADELAAVLRWVRSGRSRLAAERAEERRREERRRATPTVVPGTFPPFAEPPDDGDFVPSWTLLEFLLEVGTFIFRLVR